MQLIQEAEMGKKLQKAHILESEPFQETFGKNAQRKRPKVSVGSMSELVQDIQKKQGRYSTS